MAILKGAVLKPKLKANNYLLDKKRFGFTTHKIRNGFAL